MTAIHKAYTDLALGQLHYRAAPGTGTPVVYLHQTASSSVMWQKVMERLAGREPLYALDTPGFGGSFDPPGMPTMDDYAGWVHEAIESLGIERAHVVGHHTGSCIGVEVAARWPERVASLSMIGPVPLTQEERDEFRKISLDPFEPDAKADYLKTTWEYLEHLGANADLALHHRELVDTTRAYWGRFQAYSAVWDQEFSDAYRKVRCPLHILCATDDVLYPFFKRAQEMRPDAVAVELRGANFEPDLDPDGTAEALRRFLDGLGEG